MLNYLPYSLFKDLFYDLKMFPVAIFQVCHSVNTVCDSISTHAFQRSSKHNKSSLSYLPTQHLSQNAAEHRRSAKLNDEAP